MLLAQGSATTAEPLRCQPLAGFEDALLAGHERIASTRLDLADTLIALGNHAEAAPLIEEACQVFEAAAPDDPLRRRAEEAQAALAERSLSTTPD